MSPIFCFPPAEGYSYKKTAGLQKHYTITSWRLGADLHLLVSSVQLLFR